jgi:hypothetical protein
MFLHIREVGFCVTTVGLGDLYPYQLQDVDDNNNLMKKTLGLCLTIMNGDLYLRLWPSHAKPQQMLARV